MSLLLAAAPASAKEPLKERLAKAVKIYFVPIVPAAYAARLETDDLLSRAAPAASSAKKKYDKTVCDGALFAEFELKLLERLQPHFAGRVERAPKRFLSEKTVLGETFGAWDLNALDCDFYLLARIETADGERRALYTISGADFKSDDLLVKPVGPELVLGLYEKRAPGKKGKKVVEFGQMLIGHHSVEITSAAELAKALGDQSDGKTLAKNTRSLSLESDYFPWSAKRYSGNEWLLERDFGNLARLIGARFPARLQEGLDRFEEKLKQALEK